MSNIIEPFPGDLTLIWVSGKFNIHFCFSLISPDGTSCKTGIFQHSVFFLKDIGPEISIPNLSQPLDIGRNLYRSISNSRISGQSLIKDNYKTSNDIYMKLGPLSKLEKRNTIKLRKLDDDAILRNSESFLIFLTNRGMVQCLLFQ